MTITWPMVKKSSNGRFYVLAPPSEDQGCFFNRSGRSAPLFRVCRFIAREVVVMARWFAEAAKRENEAMKARAARIRQAFHLMDIPDEGRLRTVPLAARDRAASTAVALFRPRRLLRGEV